MELTRRGFLKLVLGANVAPPNDVDRLSARVMQLELIAVGLYNEIRLTDWIANTRQVITDARLRRLEMLLIEPQGSDRLPKECSNQKNGEC